MLALIETRCSAIKAKTNSSTSPLKPINAFHTGQSFSPTLAQRLLQARTDLALHGGTDAFAARLIPRYGWIAEILKNDPAPRDGLDTG
jgi:hypothetical protein